MVLHRDALFGQDRLVRWIDSSAALSNLPSRMQKAPVLIVETSTQARKYIEDVAPSGILSSRNMATT